MSDVVVTDRDREMAHDALTDKVSCYEGPGPVRAGLRHDWVCDEVTEAIATARDEENRACEAVAREAIADECCATCAKEHPAVLAIAKRRGP